MTRTAIISGAARGIGAAIAQRFSRDGMAVALIDLDIDGAEATAEGIRAAGGRAVAIAANVTDEAQVTDAVSRTTDELGAPTVLVNNAGILRDNLLFKMTLEDWDAVMNVHLRGAFLMTRAVQAHMVAAAWGRVISLSSISALGNRGQVNYSAAKAGLQGFTKTVAIELGPFGVTANAIAPGFIASEMTRATAERMGVDFEEFTSSVAAQTPVRRVGVPEDVANVASFLASEEASFVSGQVLYVAGGPTN
ncbi:MAG TPA: beta-ketoacyl-ACP reductase [Actinobacteria bacterium]|jgi:3-oxoacyl-[acyl-carrier protein] reductase|nr:beta-ketoacyl-ACP reductase [Actinomycetota bacterium]